MYAYNVWWEVARTLAPVDRRRPPAGRPAGRRSPAANRQPLLRRTTYANAYAPPRVYWYLRTHTTTYVDIFVVSPNLLRDLPDSFRFYFPFRFLFSSGVLSFFPFLSLFLSRSPLPLVRKSHSTRSLISMTFIRTSSGNKDGNSKERGEDPIVSYN